MNNIYKINIYEKFLDLKQSKKDINQYDNNDLWKIFEWYSCIRLKEEFNTQFYEYDDIDPDFKEVNKMSRNDTGIDASNLTDTIVQCKLRKDTLNWKDCSTFFGSQNIFSDELNETIIRWKKLIITRNECKLSDNLKDRYQLFLDKIFTREEVLNYCEKLYIEPPKYPIDDDKITLRDYQIESIDLIKKSKKNVIICLPTGTGKNLVIINSMLDNKKYLILVPRIILMEQLKEEIIKKNIKLKNKIQLIGDGNNKFNESKNITICVFNSVGLLSGYYNTFDKIYVDEAHHINQPEIYTIDDDYEIDDDIEEVTDEDDFYDSDNESVLIDDTEDELKATTNYIKIIKSLESFNNNVYLSATIDEIDKFEYYKKDIREMINQKYLCDYTIHIPIFNDDPTNKTVCQYLLKNYRNIIIYCNSRKEGIKLNKLFNKLQMNSSAYVDCLTSKKKRNEIINKYKSGKIPFLVNVRILIEGFNSPITKGVCFMHIPNTQKTLIQIIGRALRLHPQKTIANIILPFSTNDDEKHINNFMKIMARNDTRIKKSFENKTLGGYISIENDYDDEEEENRELELRYEMIYNSFGELKNYEEIWFYKLEQVKTYIDDNGKRPSRFDKNDKVKKLNVWIVNQIANYKKNQDIMKNENIRNKWYEFINDDKYKKYFISGEDNWNYKLEQVKTYIDDNKKKPTRLSKNEQILGRWIDQQLNNYKKNQYIMKNENIRNKWYEFINNEKYKKYFMSGEDNWNYKLEQVKTYIDDNKKKPTQTDKNKKFKILANWINTQVTYYKKNQLIMKNENIRNKWYEFINDDKYKNYFISDEDNWNYKLEQVKTYIDDNKKKPTHHSKNEQIKSLYVWINTQVTFYKKNQRIMKNENIRNKWYEFINDDKYKKYFMSFEDNWNYKLEQVKTYIDDNKKKPTQTDKNKNIKILCGWIKTQVTNYKKNQKIMKNENIRKKWYEFTNHEKYRQYFKT
jgi:superfamily II DNA or RNA helicase